MSRSKTTNMPLPELMKSLLTTFWVACVETPRGYFAPTIALSKLFCDTADGKSHQPSRDGR